jgi:hypothetical protein
MRRAVHGVLEIFGEPILDCFDRVRLRHFSYVRRITDRIVLRLVVGLTHCWSLYHSIPPLRSLNETLSQVEPVSLPLIGALKRQNIMAIWQPHRLEERGHELPAVVKPEGPGYMPLYFAAQWIATCGGTVVVDPLNPTVWQDAFGQLLARIASEQVALTGMRDGQREKLDGHLFAGIPVDYPFLDTPLSLLLSEELYLCSCVYIDEVHWQNDWNDRLETRHSIRWSKLMVLKSDVAHYWPFVDDPTDAARPVRQTGAPGRPTSMHLVEAEFRARWERGEVQKSIGAEADALCAWLKAAHPEAPRLTPKSIANRLRHEHRERILKAQN